MTEDTKQTNEEITRAGAVELEESKLDESSGGLNPQPLPPREALKIDPGVNIGVKLAPQLKF